MARHLAYQLNTEAPLDITIQSLISGTHVNLGKRMDLREGEDLAFWLYNEICIGVADILLVTPRDKKTLQVWTGPMRALTPAERAFASDFRGPARGGAYMKGEPSVHV